VIAVIFFKHATVISAKTIVVIVQLPDYNPTKSDNSVSYY